MDTLHDTTIPDDALDLELGDADEDGPTQGNGPGFGDDPATKRGPASVPPQEE